MVLVVAGFPDYGGRGTFCLHEHGVRIGHISGDAEANRNLRTGFVLGAGRGGERLGVGVPESRIFAPAVQVRPNSYALISGADPTNPSVIPLIRLTASIADEPARNRKSPLAASANKGFEICRLFCRSVQSIEGRCVAVMKDYWKFRKLQGWEQSTLPPKLYFQQYERATRPRIAVA
jgi:hypothetical protein